MTTLTLIRGIPGSGKSTLASQLVVAQGHAVTKHFEADMYFSRNGKYEFDATKLGAAHAWCQAETDDALFYKFNVIVSNTFTTIKELKPYFELAQKNGAKVVVLLAQSNFKNIHDVPDEALQRMRDRFVYDLTPLYDQFK